jgi:adenine-specific DNA-methyltransferase
MPTLDWLNQQDAKRIAQKVPYRLLETVPELCVGDLNTENLLIQGDNLQALKALLPMYAGKVKCIYIDPPYNTCSAFEHYDDNLEHSVWLSMMYPRLELLRELLAEDGSIWVSIDDNEAHYLKVMMDEIFGRGNFVANVVWRSSDSSNNDAKSFSLDHNHTITYGKSDEWRPKPIARKEENNMHYKNPDNDPRGAWFSGNLSSPKPRPNLTYTVNSPQGLLIYPPKNGWRWKQDTMLSMIETGEIIFAVHGARLIKKTYLADQGDLSPSTLWADIEETGHNRQAKYELKKLFPDIATAELFNTPKPEKLIQRILEIATNENDLVLDSFLGSGTTAAVAHKMNRRYIGIEMGDHAQTHCQPRLQKVVEGEQGGISKTVNWTGGGGFRFYRLGSELFDEYGTINPAIGFASLAAHIWYMETRIPLLTPVDSPLLGIHNGTAYYLLYNGILRDRRPQSGNVLTRAVLDFLPLHDGKKIIYCETSRLGQARLDAEQITFKQIPYDVRVA